MNRGACVFEFTGGRNMAGMYFRNRSITFVEDSVSGRGSNEVYEFSRLGNTAVNQETETEGTVMSECVGNNSDSLVATEASVGITTRQLQPAERCYYYLEGRHFNNVRN